MAHPRTPKTNKREKSNSILLAQGRHSRNVPADLLYKVSFSETLALEPRTELGKARIPLQVKNNLRSRN